MITFIALAFTGLIQKWPEVGFSKWAITTLGGIEATRLIHRVFATILLLAIVYHLFTAGKRILVDRAPRTMLPGRADFRAAWQGLLYNLGRRDKRPPQGRFTWEEKLEYWSIVWGTVIMTVTGFMLWNPIATAKVLPGDFIPAAKAAHGGEALLAVLAILVWHVYHVHLRSFNTSIFTGYMSREDMEHEHPLELAAIDAGETEGPPIEVEERRRRIFLPGYSVVATALIVGIYFFVTFEETAIETIEPPEDVVVFVPAPSTTVPLRTTTTVAPTTTTEPATTSTTIAARPESWDGTIADLLAASCGACHTGASGLGGLDLSSYDTALEGGESGPGILPGDPAGSSVYAVQAAGGHPGQLDDGRLARLRAWIDAGAPRREAEAGGERPEATVTWEGRIGPLLADACGACHGAGALGGLDLRTYAAALEGGNSGSGIVPGDPDASTVYARQTAGGHPGQLSDAQLAELAAWIDAGAPQS